MSQVTLLLEQFNFKLIQIGPYLTGRALSFVNIIDVKVKRYMDFNQLTTPELVDSILGEVAKTLSEIRHAQDDLDKAESRLKFALAVLHNIRDRDLKE